MKLVVTGSGGLLGREVVAAGRARGDEVVGTTRAELDVTDPEQARAVLAAARPDAVVHCAAYTAVDRAESEAELAMRVNRDGTRYVGEAAAEAGARFVAVSSDYVFDGAARTPYLPDHAPHPLSVYGRSKLEGERSALASAVGALVVRTSWLYGGGARSFVTAMIEKGRTSEAVLRVVDDQRGRPTWARNAAAGLLDLLDRRARGVWHVADGGDATWLELARETFRLCGIATPLEPVSTDAWGAAAARPRYSVLDLAGTEALLGRSMTDWRVALSDFLDEAGAKQT